MSLKTINELTEVDESQLQNDALLEGAIPPVSGSIFTPVKVTLAKLAKWILNSYTGLSLAGSSQSVKSAVDSLSGTVTTINSNVGRLKVIPETIATNASSTLTIPSAWRGLVIVDAAVNDAKTIIVVAAQNNGLVSAKAMESYSYMTVTTGTNALTISNNASVSLSVYMLSLVG